MANPIPLAELGKEGQRLAAQLRDPQQLAPLLKSAGMMMVADVKRNFNESHDPDGTPWKPLAFARPSGGSKPLQDQGLLAASFSASTGGNWAQVGSNAVQANLHQLGGTIVPKRTKYLAIPLTRQAQRAGSPRRFPGLLRCVIGAKGGVMIDAQGEPQYALTKGPIVIPARPMVGFGKRLMERLDLLFAEFMARVAGGGPK